MTQMDEAKIFQAVREAVEETVASFGIEFVRTLSFFPSAQESELKKAA